MPRSRAERIGYFVCLTGSRRTPRCRFDSDVPVASRRLRIALNRASVYFRSRKTASESCQRGNGGARHRLAERASPVTALSSPPLASTPQSVAICRRAHAPRGLWPLGAAARQRQLSDRRDGAAAAESHAGSAGVRPGSPVFGQRQSRMRYPRGSWNDRSVGETGPVRLTM